MPHSRSWLTLGFLAVSSAFLAVACGESPKHAEMVNAKGSNVPTPPNVDRTKCDDKGKNVVTADTNQDQKADVWKFYSTVDVGGQKTEVLACKEVDLNLDGKIDITRYYADGKLVREELDTNFDQRPDVWKYYENEKLVRIERDNNGDGKVDEWQYYEGGKLDRIGYDTTGNGTVNKWDRAPEGDEAEGGSGAAPASGGGAAASAPTAPPPATSPPPAGSAPAA